MEVTWTQQYKQGLDPSDSKESCHEFSDHGFSDTQTSSFKKAGLCITKAQSYT